MEPLCKIEDVVANIQIDFSDSTTPTESQVKSWIMEASERISENYGYAFAATTATAEKHDGNGTVYIKLNNRPLISVTTLVVDGATLTENTDYWIVDRDAAVIECLSAPIRREDGFSEGHANVSCTYSYGKTSVPYSVANLCALMVAVRAASAAKMGATEGGTVDSYTDGDVSIKYGSGDTQITALLAQYEEAKKEVPRKATIAIAGV